MEDYIDKLYAEDQDLIRVIQGIKEKEMPQISIAAGYGRLLTLLVKMSNASNLLEIGALGGYSGICLARGLGPDGTLLSLEINGEYAEIAKAHLQAAGLGNKVSYRIGDAKDSLKLLKEKGQRFDFFFIDADKGGYPQYLSSAIELALPGAIIVGDNALLGGKVKDASSDSSSVIAMRKFNQMMAQDPRLDSSILPAYDGLAIARVK